MKKELKYTTEILENVEVSIDNKILKVKGERGENARLFHYPGVVLKKENSQVVLYCKTASKKEKSIMGVYIAHIENMIKGVKDGYTYQLKICSGHFPMTVEIKNKQIIINNFLGEKKSRIASITENVDVKIDGDMITIEGNNKEKVGQCSANIEIATKITKRDRRIFQDGIFIVSKGEK